METKTIELTEVVLPDGSKAWFESKKSAEAVISLVGKMKELLDGRDYWLGGNKEKKPRMSGKVEGVPTEEECAKVEKKTVSSKITPPLGKTRKYRNTVIRSRQTRGAMFTRKELAMSAVTHSHRIREGRKSATLAGKLGTGGSGIGKARKPKPNMKAPMGWGEP